MNTNSFDLNKTALEQKKSCGRYQKDFRRLSAFFIVFIIMISVLAMPAFARAKAEDGGIGMTVRQNRPARLRRAAQRRSETC